MNTNHKTKTIGGILGERNGEKKNFFNRQTILYILHFILSNFDFRTQNMNIQGR